MVEKPTVLVIGERYPLLTLLEQRYNIIYRSFSLAESPFFQASSIIEKVKNDHSKIDAVVGFLDVSSVIASLIARDLGLVGCDLQALYRAQNKEVFFNLLKDLGIDESSATFFDIAKLVPSSHYPIFIKPIKGSFSAHAYVVNSEEEFKRIQSIVLKDDNRIEVAHRDFFSYFEKDYYDNLKNRYMSQLYTPYDQFNIDGFVFDHKIYSLGVTQTVYDQKKRSFARFDFPIQFEKGLQNKLDRALQQIIHKLGYNNSGFNMEFFVTEDRRILVIEVNTRISPGFGTIFQALYQTTIFEMVFQVALGKKPNVSLVKTKMVASSFPLRVAENHQVERVPTYDELTLLKRKFKIENLNVYVRPGTKLSEYRQDSYSYRYGLIDIVAPTHNEVMKRFEACMRILPRYLIMKKIGERS